MNAIQRQASEGRRARPALPRLQPGDFEVHRSDALTRSSTVLMLDMSRSMPLRGYFYAAKKVALALELADPQPVSARLAAHHRLQRHRPRDQLV